MHRCAAQLTQASTQGAKAAAGKSPNSLATREFDALEGQFCSTLHVRWLVKTKSDSYWCRDLKIDTEGRPWLPVPVEAFVHGTTWSSSEPCRRKVWVGVGRLKIQQKRGCTGIEMGHKGGEIVDVDVDVDVDEHHERCCQTSDVIRPARLKKS